MKLLNLGCGNRYHPDWTNVNFTSTGDGVIAHNLTQGIPFPDNYFDVVYHSHVLEHFPKAQAEDFIKDCYRVLCPQGILRVVVPDLEEIARTYLDAEVLNVKILRIVSKLCIGIGDTKFDQLMTLLSIDNGFYLGKTQRL
jgi:predicted SAM-dependent methyltransferase